MLDQSRIRRAFDRAAGRFEAEDFLHAEIRQRLLDRLPAVAIEPSRIVDLGAGTAAATPALKSAFPGAEIVSVDQSAAMLAQAGTPTLRLCADAASLPLTGGCADLILSSLMLQHCPDPAAALTEMRRVLSDDGVLFLTTLGRDSFIELGRAWATADDHSHIAPFFDIQDLGGLLSASGFVEPVLDSQTLTITYEDLGRLIGDLRAAGSTNATPGRNPGLTGRGAGQRFAQAYEQLRDPAGKLRVTIEVLFAVTWAGPRPGTRDTIEIPVDTLRTRRR